MGPLTPVLNGQSVVNGVQIGAEALLLPESCEIAGPLIIQEITRQNTEGLCAALYVLMTLDWIVRTELRHLLARLKAGNKDQPR